MMLLLKKPTPQTEMRSKQEASFDYPPTMVNEMTLSNFPLHTSVLEYTQLACQIFDTSRGHKVVKWVTVVCPSWFLKVLMTMHYDVSSIGRNIFTYNKCTCTMQRKTGAKIKRVLYEKGIPFDTRYVIWIHGSRLCLLIVLTSIIRDCNTIVCLLKLRHLFRPAQPQDKALISSIKLFYTPCKGIPVMLCFLFILCALGVSRIGYLHAPFHCIIIKCKTDNSDVLMLKDYNCNKAEIHHLSCLNSEVRRWRNQCRCKPSGLYIVLHIF